MYKYIYMYIYTHIYIHIYVYIYLYLYTYMYILTFGCTLRLSSSRCDVEDPTHFAARPQRVVLSVRSAPAREHNTGGG